MTRRFSDYDVAMVVRDAAKQAAREEIAQQRPPSRWARVVSIDPATRSCMVVFNGEVDAVRVPYSSVIPTVEGQEVRIGGARDDRVIEAVKGETQPETRLYSLEDEINVRQVMIASYGLTTNAQLGTSLTDIPFDLSHFDPVNMAPPNNGAFLIPRHGYYEFHVRAGFHGGSAASGFDCELAVHCLPAGGGARFLLARDVYSHNFSENIGTEYGSVRYAVGSVTLQVDEFRHFFPGDRIVASATTSQGAVNQRIVYAGRTTINIALKYGMERYYIPTPTA